MEYVQAIRIEEAKQLLEANYANVEEIGHIVGYERPHFLSAPVQAPGGHDAGSLPQEIHQDLRGGVSPLRERPRG
jgi:AraC-like DNA-binding protein